MQLPSSLEDVAGWAEAIRAERINETGRRIVDLIEHLVREMLSLDRFDDGHASATAKLTAEVSKLFGYALKADAGEHHREMHELREKANRLQRRGDRLEMH